MDILRDRTIYIIDDTDYLYHYYYFLLICNLITIASRQSPNRNGWVIIKRDYIYSDEACRPIINASPKDLSSFFSSVNQIKMYQGEDCDK